MASLGLSVTRLDIQHAEQLPQPSIIMRDRRQVEIRQSYGMPDAGEIRDYTLEVYLFLPRQMGVTAATYPKAEFYTGATSYLRLDAPGRSIHQLADLDDFRSPLAQVHDTLPSLLAPRAPPTEPLVSLVQLHAHELAESVVAGFSEIREALKVPATALVPQQDILVRMQNLLDDCEQALVAVRQVRAEVDAFGGLCHPGLERALAFAEEFVSAVQDEQVALLSQQVQTSALLRDGTGLWVRALLLLARFAQEQARLRLEAGYALPYEEPREYFAYRLGLLKKNLQQALYLNTREAAADNYLRNSAAMVAAGLAATWAFIAQAPMQFGQVNAGAQVALLGSAVGAYMLKDRIKEWTREYLTRRLRIDDYSRRIIPDALARFGLTGMSGRARERVRFMKPQEVDPEVHALRMLHRSVMGTGLELEEVLFYRRRLTLKATTRSRAPAGFGIRDILRLNLSALTRRLDDPMDDVSFYDAPSGRFVRDHLPKVYHANMLLAVASSHLPTRWLGRYRLVLNQDGLLRVEPVVMRSGRRPDKLV